MAGLFEFVCNLCDPEKDGKSASLRLLGLTLSNCILEIMGTEIVNFSSLLKLVENDLSRAFLRVIIICFLILYRILLLVML